MTIERTISPQGYKAIEKGQLLTVGFERDETIAKALHLTHERNIFYTRDGRCRSCGYKKY